MSATDPDPMTICDNCRSQYAMSELDEPEDLWQRLDPGSVVPAGQCPDCGALSYLCADGTQE